MLRAVSLIVFILAAIHFYLRAQTGHLAPCAAAYHKLETEHLSE